MNEVKVMRDDRLDAGTPGRRQEGCKCLITRPAFIQPHPSHGWLQSHLLPPTPPSHTHLLPPPSSLLPPPLPLACSQQRVTVTEPINVIVSRSSMVQKTGMMMMLMMWQILIYNNCHYGTTTRQVRWYGQSSGGCATR